MSIHKCSRVGCDREATRHDVVPIMDGAAVADVWACEEHYQEILRSLPA
jgi:hypothetical protein